MTKLLEKAISEVQQLPEKDQNAIAEMILEELEDECRWEAVFADARSHALLEKLLAEAEAEGKADLVQQDINSGDVSGLDATTQLKPSQNA